VRPRPRPLDAPSPSIASKSLESLKLFVITSALANTKHKNETRVIQNFLLNTIAFVITQESDRSKHAFVIISTTISSVTDLGKEETPFRHCLCRSQNHRPLVHVVRVALKLFDLPKIEKYTLAARSIRMNSKIQIRRRPRVQHRKHRR
jgi:hypothetical protein